MEVDIMDQTPGRPLFNPSELDGDVAGVQGDAAAARRRGEVARGNRRWRNIGVGLAVGVVIGLVLGVFFGNLIVGIVIGIVLGAGIGAVMDR
jgi:uncharacterized membrane protein